ncbi:glutathione S-transferase family protein [Phenylobacterium aquaticum]|uniref:glutathione S-transferase family protein n=2 Tax=Phenylobacterium aquaticum TaxID=1763816 RepID=UPI0026EA4C23|nr:glutathione S-transferase family protein [Phenylobacterium aquaticum]
MKLYNSVGPNPHVVRMFAAEKGLTLPMVDVDLRGGENRKPPYQDKVNVAGQTPALELADGAVISEITVICEYLEEKHPTPSLIGTNAEERAETRMWTRRVDLNICEPMANGFRAAEGRPMFEPRMKLVGAEGAAELKAIARDRILWLDGQIAGRDWIVPGRFSLADILLFGFLAFGGVVGQPLPDEAANVKAWFERVKARPSAAA